MRSFTGTGALIRHILRRDRIRLVVWIAAVGGYSIPLAASLEGLYPTPESLQARAVIMDGPLGVMFSGPRIGLDNYTFGAMLSNEFVGTLAVVLALMSVFLIVRHTRAEEESGRRELVRAAVVGRHAGVTAALIVVIAAQAAIGILIGLSYPQLGLGLSTGGSWLFAAAVVSVGVVFAGIAAIASQVTSQTRGAMGIGVAAVILTYVVRAFGDMGDNALSMLSPIGWAQATRPYVDDSWWPLALPAVFAVALVMVSLALTSRRDVGEGMVSPRPGRSEASRVLARPLGLALRLQRGLLIGWGVGLFILGASYGGFVSDVEEFAAENPFIEEALSAIGGAGLGESWASFLAVLMMALVASFTVQATLRLRSEETDLRAEHVLATPVERWRWVGSHLAVAAVGSAVIGALVGLGFGLSAGAATGDWSWIPKMMAATLSHLPALAVVGGFAFAVVGIVPRLAPAAWVGIALVWTSILGTILGLPDWVLELSPFGHDPLFPAADIELLPLLVLGAIAGLFVVGGFYAFQRRDIGVT
jgi:ABC-2 type transport system permease protein